MDMVLREPSREVETPLEFSSAEGHFPDEKLPLDHRQEIEYISEIFISLLILIFFLFLKLIFLKIFIMRLEKKV